MEVKKNVYLTRKMRYDTIRSTFADLKKMMRKEWDNLKKKYVFYIFVFALVLWMVIIFSFSSQTADESANLSGEVGRKVADMFVPGFYKWEEAKQNQFVDSIDFFVRKTAHFMEYMVMGMLWFFCLQSKPNSRFTMTQNRWISMFASAFFAMGDEFHQLFVAGRAGRWMDVGIDTAGAVTGVCLVCFGITIYKNIRKKKRD